MSEPQQDSVGLWMIQLKPGTWLAEEPKAGFKVIKITGREDKALRFRRREFAEAALAKMSSEFQQTYPNANIYSINAEPEIEWCQCPPGICWGTHPNCSCRFAEARRHGCDPTFPKETSHES